MDETYVVKVVNKVCAVYNSKGFFKRNLPPSDVKTATINENVVTITQSNGYTMLYDAETGRQLGHL